MSSIVEADEVTWPTRSECETCRLRPSSVVTTEMPIDEPIERIRLSRLAPSVRSAEVSVAKALALSGMNTSPMPIPCVKPASATRL